jgi:putative membrane protein
MELVVMMSGYGSHWDLWQVVLMWLAMVVVVVLLVWAVYALLAGGGMPDQRRHEAGAILDQRLAKGELDADEYRRMQDLLVSEDDAPAPARAGR